MFNVLAQWLREGVIFTYDQARRVHEAVIMLLLVMLALIGVMWGFNVMGYKLVNSFLFAFGGIFILVQATRPISLAAAATAGAGVARLGDKDVSQGALQGLQALYRVTLGAIFGFWVLAGLLATWSFEESPVSFFIIMGMIMMIAITVAVFKMTSTKLAGKIIIAYSVVVLLSAFWQTLTPSQKERMPMVPSASSEASDEVTPSWRSWFKDNEVIPIDLRRSQIGETTEMNVLSSSTMAIRVSSSSREVHGFTYTWACPVSDGLKFTFQNGKGTTLHHFTVTEESQKRLGKAQWIKVRFTTVLSPENPCAHLYEL